MLNNYAFEILHKNNDKLKLSSVYTIKCKKCKYSFIVLEKTIKDEELVLYCPNCGNKD